MGAGERLALRPGVRLSYRAAIHGQRGDDIPLCLVAEVHDLDAGCLAGHSLQLRHQADAADAVVPESRGPEHLHGIPDNHGVVPGIRRKAETLYPEESCIPSAVDDP